MGTSEYTIKDCETVETIANDGGVSCQRVFDANPGLQTALSDNPDVAQTNGAIFVPDPIAGTVKVSTDRNHPFVCPRKKKDLIITLQTSDGKSAELFISSINVRVETRPQPLVPQKIGPGQWRFQDYPDYASDPDLRPSLHLVLDLQSVDGLVRHKEPPIALSVGGMDPLTGTDSQRACAVQKLLANLGFYPGSIDGDLASDRSRAALRRFQFLHGIKPVDGVDNATVRELILQVGNRLKEVAVPSPAVDSDNPNFTLPLGEEAGADRVSPGDAHFFFHNNGYLEPTEVDQTKRTAIGPLRFFPSHVHVALCDEGTTVNSNVIRMRDHRFIYLDSGRWLKDRRNFSVIWGRHAYLCEYLPDGGGDLLSSSARTGLDKEFFLGMTDVQKSEVKTSPDTSSFTINSSNATYSSSDADAPPGPVCAVQGAANKASYVKVVQRSCAYWAPEGDFDWDQLIVVIPDTHLMNDVDGSVWRSEFKLKPELDLLHFAERLEKIETLKGKLHVIHIGDVYDLWVGRPRFWKQNDKWIMQLIEKPSDQKWSCGKPDCKGHANEKRNEVCPGKWKCGRVRPPCPGHDSKAGPPCDVVAYRRDFAVPTGWSCGRAWPECPGDHSGPDEVCTDEKNNPGMFWTCRRLEPPCFGHAHKNDPPCVDITSGAEEIRSWIREIQGYGRPWVRRLLSQSNHDDRRGESLESLEAKLTNGQCGENWLNPAETAFHRLQGFATLQYLYGNHDNYMIDERVASGFGQRERVIEIGGIFFEHGHRLESTLVMPPIGIPDNQDGSVSGYEATLDVYRNRERLITLMKRGLPPEPVPPGPAKTVLGAVTYGTGSSDAPPGYKILVGLEDLADKGAKIVEQPQYEAEFACIVLGRSSKNQSLKPPHVFVMGHTHCPKLACIVVDPGVRR